MSELISGWNHPKPKPEFIKLPVLRGFTEIKALYGFLGLYRAFICGGYVRHMISEHPSGFPNDVDVYVQDQTSFDEIRKEIASTNTYVRLTVAKETKFSITYNIPSLFHILDSKAEVHPFCAAPQIQLIKPIVKKDGTALYGSMEEVLRSFDFSVVRCGLLTEDEALVDSDFRRDELHKALNIKYMYSPLQAIWRCQKYINKGYHMRAGTMLKLLEAWENRDDKYKDMMRRKMQQIEATTDSEDPLSEYLFLLGE